MQPIESEQTSGTKQLASGSTATPAATVQQIVETQHTLQQANLLAVHRYRPLHTLRQANLLPEHRYRTVHMSINRPICDEYTDTEHHAMHASQARRAQAEE